MTTPEGMTPEETEALAEAAADLLRDHCTPQRLAAADGGTDTALWQLLHDSGLTRIGISEDAGGSGGGLAEAAVVLRLAGQYAAPVPLAESSLLGGWLLQLAGLKQPDGMATTGEASVRAEPAEGGWRVHGTVRRVPAAADAELLVVLAAAEAGPVVVALPLAGRVRLPGRNLADEARDDVLVDEVVQAVLPVPPGTARELRLRGALSRSLLIAGALDQALALSVQYARERVQFGRPLAAFQAVQQQVAALAGEAAAARAVTDAAVRTCAQGFDGDGPAFAVAAAKVRSAQAASVGAAIAHQVHGAIGMTQEHALRFSTTRLWSWRAEWGGEAQWSEELADQAVAAGPAGLWPLLADA